MPGKKNVFRLYANDGHAIIDLMMLPDEKPPEENKRVLCRHPFQESKRAWVIPSKVESMYTCWWENGQVREETPTLSEVTFWHRFSFSFQSELCFSYSNIRLENMFRNHWRHWGRIARGLLIQHHTRYMINGSFAVVWEWKTTTACLKRTTVWGNQKQ